MNTTTLRDIEAQFNAWFAVTIKAKFQLRASDFFIDFLDALDNEEVNYEMPGFYTISNRPEIVYPNLKASA